MEAAADPRVYVDHAFLESVEAEIAQALEHASELAAGLDHLHFDPHISWSEAFDHLNVNLAGWEGKLAELTQRTAAAETELNQQEEALRTWLQLMRVASSWLSEATQAAATSLT